MLAVLAISVAVAAPVTGPVAGADELDSRKQRVERRITETEKHLHHSSTRLVEAAKRLDGAVAELARARTDLGRARDDLAAAKAHERRMEAALEAAVAEEARARAALEAGQAAVAAGEQELRVVAIQMQSGGGADLMAVSAVIRSQEPAQVTGGLGTRRTLLEKEAAALSRLDAAAVMLTVQEAALEAATEEAVRRREAATASLLHTSRVEAQAEAARSRVRDLVSVRREARKEAAAAKAEDLRRLRQFRRERQRISEQLRRRAAAHRGASDSRLPGALVKPVDGYVTSSFGMRLHPVYEQWTLHDGTDFGAPCGTPIRAARSGTVIGSYHDYAYGKRVIVDHGWVGGGGLGTSYNHLSRFSTHVGERVRRGEIVGYVGDTGYSTGCHLHFMVFRNGAVVNPVPWL